MMVIPFLSNIVLDIKLLLSCANDVISGFNAHEFGAIDLIFCWFLRFLLAF